jgi:ribosomal protein L33
MFIMWGNKWKNKPKENGLRVKRMCPECDREGMFAEVIPTNYFTIYTIPLFETDSKKPRLECPNCHSLFYIKPSDYDAAIKQKKQKPEQKYTIIICDFCKKQLRVPLLDKKIKVTCRNCTDEFYVKNGKVVETF